MSSSNEATETRIQVHFLRLHESPILDGDNYERFDQKWVVDDESGSTEPKQPDSKDNKEVNWSGIREGDLLFFPELQSGAGEFEGLRMAGKRTAEGKIPLLECGIESPEFPSDIISFIESEQSSTLRAAYEKPLEAVLEDQGFSLADLFGGEEVVEEFWSAPPTKREKDRSGQGEWCIPLSECTVLRSQIF